MTRTTALRRALPALLVLLLPGCSVFRREVPLSPEQTFQRGMEAYQNKSYRRATVFLGRWVQSQAADPRLPQALLALARSRMHTNEELTAASEFLRIVTDFPTAPEQQEARFGICEAYHALSPKPPLDQEYTRAAITYCDSYAQYYAATPEAAQAREWVTQMRRKLAEKSYQNGIFYFRRGAFDAAVIYFEEAAREYPDTEVAPAALLKIVESYERIGYAEEAEAARVRLRQQYPQSAEAQSLASNAPS